MTKYIYSLLFMLLLSTVKLMAQDNTALSARELQIKEVLKMNSSDYAVFSKAMKQYDKQLATVFKDTTMNKKERNAAIEKVLAEKRAYIEQHLTEAQRKALLDFERNSAAAQGSPHQKQIKESQERLRKKGIKPVTANAKQ